MNPSLTYFVVHNDFHESRGIFPIFDGLEVKDMDKPLHNPSADIPGVNGSEATNGTNGVHDTNGTKSEQAGPRKEENPSLIDAAKAAAVEVTNGMTGLAASN
jgi:methylenetetrahydrofolate reductase (NADPH)